MAERHLRGRGERVPADASLEPGALVNETYLRLIRQRKRFDNRGHFFAIATRVMLRVLQDHDRARRARKREGSRLRVTLTGLAVAAADPPAADVAALIEAFEQLEHAGERTAEVAKLRLLWGLTNAETAEALQVSVPTAQREWRFVRRWMQRRLG